MSQRSILSGKKKKKKKICKVVNFAVPGDHRIKMKECEKKDKYLDLARELKKTMEHKGDNFTNCDWCFWNSHQSVAYSHTNTSRNIIKHNLGTSMNERTHFFIKIYISHFILVRVDVSLVCER